MLVCTDTRLYLELDGAGVLVGGSQGKTSRSCGNAAYPHLWEKVWGRFLIGNQQSSELKLLLINYNYKK